MLHVHVNAPKCVNLPKRTHFHSSWLGSPCYHKHKGASVRPPMVPTALPTRKVFRLYSSCFESVHLGSLRCSQTLRANVHIDWVNIRKSHPKIKMSQRGKKRCTATKECWLVRPVGCDRILRFRLIFYMWSPKLGWNLYFLILKDIFDQACSHPRYVFLDDFFLR